MTNENLKAQYSAQTGAIHKQELLKRWESFFTFDEAQYPKIPQERLVEAQLSELFSRSEGIASFIKEHGQDIGFPALENNIIDCFQFILPDDGGHVFAACVETFPDELREKFKTEKYQDIILYALLNVRELTRKNFSAFETFIAAVEEHNLPRNIIRKEQAATPLDNFLGNLMDEQNRMEIEICDDEEIALLLRNWSRLIDNSYYLLFQNGGEERYLFPKSFEAVKEINKSLGYPLLDNTP